MKVIKSTVAMVLSLSLLSTSCMTSKCSATQEATNTESTASKDSSKGKDILINQQSGNSFSNQELEKLLNEKFERQQQQWQQWQQQQWKQWQQQQEEKEEKDKKSPIYEQLDKKPKSVIILDDYDKMKMLPNNKFSNNDYDSENPNVIQDRTADEVLKSIAENGKYYANGNLVDCSKAIFIVTTNENKEEVEKYFGVSGKKGGGIQRLRIA